MSSSPKIIETSGGGGDTQNIANTLEVKPKDRDSCLREIGYAQVYMRYLSPGFLDREPGKAQAKRVRTLMLEIAVNWKHPDSGYWQSLFYRIAKEIENMC